MRIAYFSAVALAAMMALGCKSENTTGEAAGPNAASHRVAIEDQAQATLRQMTAQDPSLQSVLDSSYAYAVIPEVGSAAAGIGAAGGQGVVYRNGQRIGTVKLNQLSIGPQAGGQTYSELIVFKDEDAFRRFQSGKLEFGSEASATLIKSGAAASARFENGVAVYILPKGGLAAGVSVNGQKLTFMPDNNSGT